jgi:EpsI family protein
VVIGLVLLISWRFFDRPLDAPAVDIERIEASPLLARLESLHIGMPAALLALMAILLIGQGWARAADALSAPLQRTVDLPEVPGWHRVAYAPMVAWAPRAQGADHRLLGRYADAQGRVVDVFLAVYAAQDEGREAGGFGQGALPPGGLWAWQAPGPAIADGHSDRLLAQGRVARLAYSWYRTGSLTTGSNARLKLANMADRLLLRERATVLLILSAEEHDGQSVQPALDAFLRAMGPRDRWMDHTAGLR